MRRCGILSVVFKTPKCTSHLGIGLDGVDCVDDPGGRPLNGAGVVRSSALRNPKPVSPLTLGVVHPSLSMARSLGSIQVSTLRSSLHPRAAWAHLHSCCEAHVRGVADVGSCSPARRAAGGRRRSPTTGAPARRSSRSGHGSAERWNEIPEPAGCGNEGSLFTTRGSWNRHVCLHHGTWGLRR